MAETRQWVVSLLRRAGYPKAAEDAERVLPERVTMDQIRAFADRHGISHDEIVSQMGGSP
jgi:hypothetical protein